MNNSIQELKLAKEWIECMSYNPSMTKLAAGSHDNNIYIYNASATKYSNFCVLKGHTSFVTSLDWSMSDSPEYIRSNCGGYELLFFNVDNK
jgi:WD40 repeat protein